MKIEYTFKLDNELKSYILEFDEKLNLRNFTSSQVEWSKLENIKCPNCPLLPDENKYCPLANNLYKIIKDFANVESTKQYEITIKTENRTFCKTSSIQEGLSSLLGLIMPTSGCPILQKLKPMVKFHLPFANSTETEYRVYSSYLFLQYFKMKEGGNPDWEMIQLNDLYAEISIVNQNLVTKIRQLETKDANLNAIIRLSTFSTFVTLNLTEEELSEFRDLFEDLL